MNDKKPSLDDILVFYERTFGSYNPSGIKVLDELKKYCYFMQSPLCTNDGKTDEFKTAMNIGRQEVIHHIMGMVKKAELAAQAVALSQTIGEGNSYE